MLSKEFNLKTAIVGSTALTFFSLMAVEIAQAQNYDATTRPGRRYASEFFLRTGVTDNASGNPNLGRFLDSIEDYQITDNLNPAAPTVVPNSPRDFLTLRSIIPVTLPSLLNTSYPRYGFTNFSGPFYEYTFLVNPTFPVGTLQTNNTPLPLGPDNTLRWYIPSKFIYTAPTDARKTFTFDASNPPVDLLNSLKGFSRILSTARSVGIQAIAFPSNIPNSQTSPAGVDDGDFLTSVEFSTTPIPEANASVGLVALGLVGGFMLSKRK